MTLDEIGLKFGTDKASNYHDYLRFYDRLLSPLRQSKFVMFEIGVFKGGSVATWAEYFPNAMIVGLDIDLATRQYQKGRIQIRIGDGTDIGFLSSIVAEFGRPLLVIDDASHLWQHQIDTFKHLFPSLIEEGIFIIEDLHTSFDMLAPEYAGGATTSAVDYLLSLTRAVTGAGWTSAKPPDESLASSVSSIEWAKGTCAIRKRA